MAIRSTHRDYSLHDYQYDYRRRRGMASVASSTIGYTWSSSGYVTSSSISDDDMNGLNGEEYDRDCVYSVGVEDEIKGDMGDNNLYPGICPYCKHIYKKPVTLQCGHSLCSHCSDTLLATIDNSSSIPRTRIRMGISSYSRTSLNKTLSSNSLNRSFSLWKSPRCIVCGELPKKSPPVPNRDLDAFLNTIQLPSQLRQLYDEDRDIRSSPLSFDQHIDSTSRITIIDCNVAIVGSKGVGKSSIQQTQLGNDMLIDELLGISREDRRVQLNESPLSDISSNQLNHSKRRGGVSYMLKMLDSHSLSDKISLSMGVIIVYSLIDRDSFIDAHHLLSIFIAHRGSHMPMVLVGSKSDLEKRRVVQSYEGQQLAKQFNCPFLEVSSRRNECINETFIELVRIMESRGLLE